jgi:nucleoside-diphosphate-sugar epimerase
LRLLVTGASGFIGRAVLVRFAADPTCRIRGVVRCKTLDLPAGVEQMLIPDLAPDTDWKPSLSGVDVIVHTAARAHVMHESGADPLAEFRRINVAGTLKLARQAADEGVRRLVFISSIKVNGEGTQPGQPYSADDIPAPVDPYGISKHEAELGLAKLAEDSGLEVVIVRPPLVYGPGVKANFLSLLKFVNKGIPMPLASINNRRSMIYLGNLIDAIAACATHPRAAGQTYLVCDGEDVSTPELIKRVAAALGVSARLLPFPPELMRIAGKVIGKGPLIERLLGSLTVDVGKIKCELDWKPPYTMKQGLKETAAWFKQQG